LKDVGVNGRIILNWTLKKYDMVVDWVDVVRMGESSGFS